MIVVATEMNVNTCPCTLIQRKEYKKKQITLKKSMINLIKFLLHFLKLLLLQKKIFKLVQNS